jgi:hypothetical protein
MVTARTLRPEKRSASFSWLPSPIEKSTIYLMNLSVHASTFGGIVAILDLDFRF